MPSAYSGSLCPTSTPYGLACPGRRACARAAQQFRNNNYDQVRTGLTVASALNTRSHLKSPGDYPTHMSARICAPCRHQMAMEVGVQPPCRFLDAHGAAQMANPCASAPSGDHHLSAGMRMIVVSWMIEVAEEFRLQQETLHLSICLLDRFLGSTQDVPRCVLQLLAVTCTMLASKHCEVVQPTVQQLCAVTAHHFQARGDRAAC